MKSGGLRALHIQSVLLTLLPKLHTHLKTVIAELRWSIFFQSSFFEIGWR